MGVGIISEMLVMFCFFWPGSGCTHWCIFLLGHLSFSDFCYSTTTGSRTLVGFFAKKSVPFSGCSLQCLIFCTFAEPECLKLVVMALDGHKASSNPFLFTFPKSSRVCTLLMAGEHMVGITDALVNTMLICSLCSCGSNEVSHFCDVPPGLLLHLFLSCPLTAPYTPPFCVPSHKALFSASNQSISQRYG